MDEHHIARQLDQISKKLDKMIDIFKSIEKLVVDIKVNDLRRQIHEVEK